MPGLLALDIDGTLTNEAHSLPASVEKAIREYYQKGWAIFFLTGRTFKWVYPSLQSFDFPYSLAVQNGATLLKMPEKEIIKTFDLDVSFLQLIDQCLIEPEVDYAIYSGYSEGDVIYYRKPLYEKNGYIQYRAAKLEEEWIGLNHWNELPFSKFSSIKWIGSFQSLSKIVNQLDMSLDLHLPLNTDPINPDYRIAQATNPKATKGAVIESSRILQPNLYPIIAAGNDSNDYEMLKVADIKIAMEGSPQHLLDIADIIAPNILEAIEEGIRRAWKKSTL